MNKNNALIGILFILFCTIFYFLGLTNGAKRSSTTTASNTKDYEAACILSDCCRNMIDNIGIDAEEIYYEYIDNLDCYNLSITKDDLNKYSWCY